MVWLSAPRKSKVEKKDQKHFIIEKEDEDGKDLKKDIVVYFKTEKMDRP